jgi:hypothetical protein
VSQYEPLIGAVVVLVFSGLVIIFSSKKFRTKFPPVFRKLTAAIKLRRAIGLAVEDGTRIHISLGNGSLVDPANPSALVGLSTLNRIGQMASTSDLPPMCTSGSGDMQILSQDVMRGNAADMHTLSQLDPGLARMTGVTPFSYAIGTMESMQDSGTSANVFMGDFGAEAGLLCDAAENQNSYNLAGSNSIIAQSIFFALADDALIGEEIYALPAYLGSQAAHQASLRVQDILRFAVILVLLVAVFSRLAGWV